MKIECIVVEDEPLATEKLVGYIQQLNFISLKATFNNGITAINYLKDNHIDLIFLDIRMKPLDGLKFLDALEKKPRIIITSAYGEYAIKGYEHNVSDFLLKPFGFERFLQAINKVTNDRRDHSKNENEFIFVKTEYRIERVDLKDIYLVEGMKDYLSIVLTDKKIMTLMSFSDIMELLPATMFARVHKSFIVALGKIKSIERARISIKDKVIPISETYRERFYQSLKDKNYML